MFRNPYSGKTWKKYGQHKSVQETKPYTGNSIPGLSPVASSYLRARYNPFLDINPRPCVPDIISIPTEKRKLSIRAKCYTGSDGIGYVIVDPQMAISAADATEINTNWCAPCWYSPKNNTMASIPKVVDYILTGTAPPATEAEAAYFDNGITGAQLRSAQSKVFKNYDWRVVGCGLRIKYIGTAESRKGTYVLYQSEQNTGYNLDTVGATEGQILNSNHLSTQTSITESEQCVLWHPRKPTDLGFQINRVPTLVGGAGGFEPYFAEGVASIGVFIFGPANQEFLFEVDGYYEFTGSEFKMKTKSDCDILGMSIVQSLTPSETPMGSASIQYGKKYAEVAGGKASKSTVPMNNIYEKGWVKGPFGWEPTTKPVDQHWPGWQKDPPPPGEKLA